MDSAFDKVDTKTLERLQSPVLLIAGGEDTGATQAAVTFLSTMREAAKRPCEIFIYPGADHGYAQSLFRVTTQKPSVSLASWSRIFLPLIWGLTMGRRKGHRTYC
jgi:dienelactone hydrolase